LLRFVTELDKDGRRSFLLFMTGSPRLPNGGFAGMDPKFTVVLKKPEVPKGTKQAIS
jgi:E3 ubiquitin-protein ligase TRIP12